MKRIVVSLLIGVGIMALLNYLPKWLDRRQNNSTAAAGASKFFYDVRGSMYAAIPIKDEIGIIQPVVWVIALSLIAWLLMPRALR